jgi:hypothetical protein
MDFHILESPPPNVLTINDEFDAAMALKWLRLNHHTERKQYTFNHSLLKTMTTYIYCSSRIDSILIYGATLESYCCINALIVNGIPSKSIKLILPPVTTHVSYLFIIIIVVLVVTLRSSYKQS